MHAGSYTVPYKVQLSYWLHGTSAGLHEESEVGEPGGFWIYVAYGILSLRYLVTRGMSVLLACKKYTWPYLGCVVMVKQGGETYCSGMVTICHKQPWAMNPGSKHPYLV